MIFQLKHELLRESNAVALDSLHQDTGFYLVERAKSESSMTLWPRKTRMARSIFSNETGVVVITLFVS